MYKNEKVLEKRRKNIGKKFYKKFLIFFSFFIFYFFLIFSVKFFFSIFSSFFLLKPSHFYTYWCYDVCFTKIFLCIENKAFYHKLYYHRIMNKPLLKFDLHFIILSNLFVWTLYSLDTKISLKQRAEHKQKFRVSCNWLFWNTGHCKSERAIIWDII